MNDKNATQIIQLVGKQDLLQGIKLAIKNLWRIFVNFVQSCDNEFGNRLKTKKSWIWCKSLVSKDVTFVLHHLYIDCLLPSQHFSLCLALQLGEYWPWLMHTAPWVSCLPPLTHSQDMRKLLAWAASQWQGVGQKLLTYPRCQRKSSHLPQERTLFSWNLHHTDGHLDDIPNI